MKIKLFISLVLLCAIAGGVTLAQAQSPSKEQTIGFIVDMTNECMPNYGGRASVSSDEVMTITFQPSNPIVIKFALKHIGRIVDHDTSFNLHCREEEGECESWHWLNDGDGHKKTVHEFFWCKDKDAKNKKLIKAFTHLIKLYDAEPSLF